MKYRVSALSLFLLLVAVPAVGETVPMVHSFCPNAPHYNKWEKSSETYPKKIFKDIYSSRIASVSLKGVFPKLLGKTVSEGEETLKEKLQSSEGKEGSEIVRFHPVPFLNGAHLLQGYGSLTLEDKRTVELGFYENLLVLCDEGGDPWYVWLDRS